jgi:hypothetical protein
VQAGSDAVYCHHRRAELGLIHKHAVILFELRGHRPFGIVKIFPNGPVVLPSNHSHSARTCSACVPLWPCVMSDSTRWSTSGTRA